MEMDLNELIAAVTTAVREEIGDHKISDAVHIQHHDFIAAWIDREQTKFKRRERIRTNVYGWFIITMIGGIGTGAYNLIQYLREHLR